MERQLVGVLSDTLKEPYGGQKVYILESGMYQLDRGDTITFEVLKSLRDRGLYNTVKIDTKNVEDLKTILPEKVDVRNPNNAIYKVGELICRISPTLDFPYAGDLVFASNIPNYYITENGYILNNVTMKLLSSQGALIRNELVFKGHEVYKISPDLTKKESAFAHWFMHKTLPLIVAIIIIALVVLWGLPVVQTTLKTQNGVSNMLNGQKSKTATSTPGVDLSPSDGLLLP